MNGLRLPGPSPKEDLDEDFERFSMSSHAGGVHNPWPELVDPSALASPWSNPLLRLLYLPMTLNEYEQWLMARQQGHASLRSRIALWHERTHLLFDFTPAKEWMRMCLALVYYHGVIGLISHSGKEWDGQATRSWWLFNTFHELLLSTLLDIQLAEELLATAFSFAMVSREVSIAPSAKRALLREQARSMGPQAKEFRRLYPSFERLVDLVASSGDSLKASAVLGRLGLYLEPITPQAKQWEFPVTVERSHHSTFPSADQSEPRCRVLAEQLDTFESFADLVTWLDKALEDREQVSSWEVIYSLAPAEDDEGVQQILSSLWYLTHGQRPEDRQREGYFTPARSLIEQYWNWEFFEQPELAVFCILIPREYAGEWFVGPEDPDNIGTMSEEKYADDFWNLLLVDGFRQQLIQKRGVVCPRYNGSCRCKAMLSRRERVVMRIGWPVADWQRGVNNLSRWAREGRFGPSDWWSDLPAACQQTSR